MDFRGFVDLKISAKFLGLCLFFYIVWNRFSKGVCVPRKGERPLICNEFSRKGKNRKSDRRKTEQYI